MCVKLIHLASFVFCLSLVLTGAAQADLVGWWKLDEGSGTVANDTSGFGHHGTITKPIWEVGRFGSALKFEGSSYVDIPAESWSTIERQATMAFWAYGDPASQPQANFIFGAFQDPANNESRVMSAHVPWSNGNVYFDTGGTTAGGYDRIQKAATAAEYEGSWQHWAFVKNADTGEQMIYLNGALWHSGTGMTRPMTGVTKFTIGTKPSLAEGWYYGMMDDVRLYDHPLSKEEILAVLEGAGAGYPYALGPDPADGALHADTWVNLSWKPGDFAVSHNVYLGDSFDDVNNGTGDTFRGNQATPFLVVGFPGVPYPDGLVPGTTYYWRVDEVNQVDPNSPWKGPIWSFTVPPKKAYNPNPPEGAKYVDTGVALNWTAGLGAKLHYVYFGDNFDTVNNATVGAPRGTTTYTPTGPLAKGKTYYWRIDEFDAAATHKGDVWSFTTLPDIAITNPDLIGWWKFDEGYGKKAIDFSGHGNDGTLAGTTSWTEGIMEGAVDLRGGYVAIDGVDNDITGTNMTLSIWIKTTQSTEGELFALNDSGGSYALLFGIQGGNVYRWDTADEQYPPAINDDQWHMITYVRNGSTAYIYVDGVQRVVQSSTFTLDSVALWSIGQEWDPPNPSDIYQGLVDDARIYKKALTADEVKQLMRGDPLLAWQPSPDNRSTVDVDKAKQGLTWSAGDTATQHDVYFGTNQAAVAAANTSDTTGVYRGRRALARYTPTEVLAWGTGPYYWRIDEVKADGTISTGAVWSFSVAGYLIVDDIESYNDIDPPNAGSNRVFDKWVDGFGTTTNGALVGNSLPPYTQRSNPHSGGQAMPFSYDNNRKFSEATLTLTAGKDWTREGVAELSLWYRGVATNAADRMYVALNGTAVVYQTDTSLTQKTGWTEWVIPLQQFTGLGVNLTNVTSITIGFGTRGNTTVAGGTGQMYIDDIRLSRPGTAQ